MAKVFGVQELKESLTASVNAIIKSTSSLTKLGELTRQRIYQTVKQGQSMAGGTKHKLKELSEGYKKYRRKYQSIYNTGEFFAPTRSNLTFSGQMLDALTYRVKQSSGSFEIFVKDTMRRQTNKVNEAKAVKALSNKKTRRKAQKALSSRTGQRSEDKTNAEVARSVAEKGRPFIGLDARSRDRLRSEIIKDLRRSLRSSGLRK